MRWEVGSSGKMKVVSVGRLIWGLYHQEPEGLPTDPDSNRESHREDILSFIHGELGYKRFIGFLANEKEISVRKGNISMLLDIWFHLIYFIHLSPTTEEIYWTQTFPEALCTKGTICTSPLQVSSPRTIPWAERHFSLFLAPNSLTHKVAASCGGVGAWEGGVGHVAKGPP